MTSEYTNNDNIYFLNDKNISQTLDGEQVPHLNPIPSLKLVKELNDGINQKIVTLCGDLCSTVDNRISEKAYELSNVLSNYTNSQCQTLDTKIDIKTNELNSKIDSNFNQLCTVISNNFETLDNKIDQEIDNLSSTVHNTGYVTPYNFDFKYEDHKIILSIDNRLGESGIKVFDISTAEFERGRILESVSKGINPKTGNIALILIFKLEDGTNYTIYIDLNEIAAIYQSGFGINISEDLTISVTDDIAKSVDLNNLQTNFTDLKNHVSTDIQLDERFEDNEYQISVLNIKNIHELKFLGHLNIINVGQTSSIIDLLKNCSLVEQGYVYNGSIFNVSMPIDHLSVEYITTDNVKLHNGDWVVVHKHDKIDKINVETILSSDIYNIHADVTRTEFDKEVQERKEADAVISNWLTCNFHNTGLYHDLQITQFNYELSATKSLTVDSDIFIGPNVDKRILKTNGNELYILNDTLCANENIVYVKNLTADAISVDFNKLTDGETSIAEMSAFLSSEISSNDNDISCLSVNLDDLSAKYVDTVNTLKDVYNRFNTITIDSNLSDVLCVIVDLKNKFNTLKQ